MKFTLKLIPLIVAVLFAISLGGLRCPLFLKEETEIEAEDAPLKCAVLRVWQHRKANGLVNYHFQNDHIFEQIWAKNRETAIKKFMTKHNVFSMEKMKGWGVSIGDQAAYFWIYLRV